MKYMGSKAKYAENILDAIEKEVHSRIYEYHNYMEPFVGGANVIDHTEKYNALRSMQRIGNDINPYLIEIFRAVQKGWKPSDKYTEEDYKLAKENSKETWKTASPDLMIAEIGFIGIGCSYAGKWFGGYARGNDNKGNPRNYALESKKNLLKQAENLRGVIFTNEEYFEMDMDKFRKAIIYCDPPYEGTTKYKDKFNHERFWMWCDAMRDKGHKVFVSEYNAPEGWRCIWEKVVNSSLTKETGSKKATEKLFTK
jgi:DNA adenine methylase